MPRRRRDLLAEANAKLAELRSKLHSVESETILPLRMKLAEIEQSHARLTKDLAHVTKMHDLYRAGFTALMDLTQILASGKRA